MPAVEQRAYEDRLRDYEEFFDRDSPFIKLWFSRSPGYTEPQVQERIRARALVKPEAPEATEPEDLSGIFIQITRSRRTSAIAPLRRHLMVAMATALAAGLYFL